MQPLLDSLGSLPRIHKIVLVPSDQSEPDQIPPPFPPSIAPNFFEKAPSLHELVCFADDQQGLSWIQKDSNILIVEIDTEYDYREWIYD